MAFVVIFLFELHVTLGKTKINIKFLYMWAHVRPAKPSLIQRQCKSIFGPSAYIIYADESKNRNIAKGITLKIILYLWRASTVGIGAVHIRRRHFVDGIS